MSKFKNNQVFLILNSDEISMQIINYSTSKSADTLPSKISDGVVKKIIETTEPVHTVYSNYTWYSIDEIRAAWEALP